MTTPLPDMAEMQKQINAEYEAAVKKYATTEVNPDVAEIMALSDERCGRVEAKLSDNKERAALEAKVTELADERDTHWNSCKWLLEQLNEAKAALAEAQKDAERWRYCLETEQAAMHVVLLFFGYPAATKLDPSDFPTYAHYVNACADAAIAASRVTVNGEMTEIITTEQTPSRAE